MNAFIYANEQSKCEHHICSAHYLERIAYVLGEAII